MLEAREMLITCKQMRQSNDIFQHAPIHITSPLCTLNPNTSHNANSRQNEYEWDTCGIKWQLKIKKRKALQDRTTSTFLNTDYKMCS